ALPTLVQAIQGHHRGYHWLRMHHLVAIAESDPKGRYEVKDDRVRATYGHTVEVNLDLPTENVPDELYYPAEDARAAGVVRTPEPVILSIDAEAARAEGIVIMRAGKTVYLVDNVPAKFLQRHSPEATESN
ncbi:MAG: hypothetical protein L3J86_05260, partial [Thermoplasmata archaeon]|nr:hypothetical protein [Thermoplasmata archaeon]